MMSIACAVSLNAERGSCQFQVWVEMLGAVAAALAADGEAASVDASWVEEVAKATGDH